MSTVESIARPRRNGERRRAPTASISKESQIGRAVQQECRDLHSFPTRRSSDLTMRDIKSKNVYSRVNSKATTQWRKTESANGVHLEGVADRKSGSAGMPRSTLFPYTTLFRSDDEGHKK